MDDVQRGAIVSDRGVRGVERVRHLRRDAQRDRHGHRCVRGEAPVRQARDVEAVDQLEHLKSDAVDDAEVDHRDEVRVVQPAREPRLVDEHALQPLVAHALRGHALDGHAPAEPRVTVQHRFPHLGHASVAEWAQQLVLPGEASHRSADASAHTNFNHRRGG